MKAEDGSVTATDVLRMRLLVSVLLCHAASAHAPNETRKLKCGVAERDWPRLIARVLAALFFGKPRQSLVSPSIQPSTAYPMIIIEAWATAIWAINACRAALSIVRTTGPLLRHVELSTGIEQGEVRQKPLQGDGRGIRDADEGDAFSDRQEESASSPIFALGYAKSPRSEAQMCRSIRCARRNPARGKSAP